MARIFNNTQEIFDYFLGAANIEVWPTEGTEPIKIQITDLLTWASLNTMKKYEAYEVDYFDDTHVYMTCVGELGDDVNCSLTNNDWWMNTGQKDQMLIDYLSDPANVRFTDCRTVDQLPTEFLTAAEKAAKQTEQ